MTRHNADVFPDRHNRSHLRVKSDPFYLVILVVLVIRNQPFIWGRTGRPERAGTHG